MFVNLIRIYFVSIIIFVLYYSCSELMNIKKNKTYINLHKARHFADPVTFGLREVFRIKEEEVLLR